MEAIGMLYIIIVLIEHFWQATVKSKYDKSRLWRSIQKHHEFVSGAEEYSTWNIMRDRDIKTVAILLSILHNNFLKILNLLNKYQASCLLGWKIEQTQHQ